MTESAIMWLTFSGFASIAAFLAGAWSTDAAWAHRTRVREMVHKEKMALIEARRRMLEGGE